MILWYKLDYDFWFIINHLFFNIDYFQASWYMVGYLFLILVTTLGNLLIILAVLLQPHMRTVTNMFYLNLASADFVVGVWSMSMLLIEMLHGCWPLGPVACDLSLVIDYIFTTASFFGLCAIAADRYIAISDPFKHMRIHSKKR